MNSDVGRYKNRELEVLGNITMDYSYLAIFFQWIIAIFLSLQHFWTCRHI